MKKGELAVMLDLETMGNKPGAAIVAIGAVRFDYGGSIQEEFYQRVDLQSCLDAGLTMDAGTVLWWLKQSEHARTEMTEPSGREMLTYALSRFAAWLPVGPFGAPFDLWGNGPSFDCAVLATAMRADGRSVPWDFRRERCFRTMRALVPDLAVADEGTRHHALDDARWQARYVLKAWDVLNPQPSTVEGSSHE